MRIRSGPFRAAALAVVLALDAPLPAGAQTTAPMGRPMTDAQAAELQGFSRGFAARCEEECDARDEGVACVIGCSCLVGQLALRIDPATLDPPADPTPPGPADFVAFVEANRQAFVEAYEICGVPIE